MIVAVGGFRKIHTLFVKVNALICLPRLGMTFPEDKVRGCEILHFPLRKYYLSTFLPVVVKFYHFKCEFFSLIYLFQFQKSLR